MLGLILSLLISQFFAVTAYSPSSENDTDNSSFNWRKAITDLNDRDPDALDKLDWKKICIDMLRTLPNVKDFDLVEVGEDESEEANSKMSSTLNKAGYSGRGGSFSFGGKFSKNRISRESMIQSIQNIPDSAVDWKIAAAQILERFDPIEETTEEVPVEESVEEDDTIGLPTSTKEWIAFLTERIKDIKESDIDFKKVLLAIAKSLSLENFDFASLIKGHTSDSKTAQNSFHSTYSRSEESNFDNAAAKSAFVSMIQEADSKSIDWKSALVQLLNSASKDKEEAKESEEPIKSDVFKNYMQEHYKQSVNWESDDSF